MPSGSSACLIARRAWMRARRREAREFGALELADAVLGRDRAAGGGDKVVDHPRDRLPSPRTNPAPRGCRRGRGNGCCRRPDGRSRWRRRPGTLARPGRGRLDDEGGMSATGTEMSCASVCPSARSASEIESRIFQNASACASLAASTASPMMPCCKRCAEQPLQLGGDVRVADRRSSPRPARATVLARQRRARVRERA